MSASHGDLVQHISSLRDLSLMLELEAEQFERRVMPRRADTLPSPPPSAPADESGAHHLPPDSSQGELPVVLGDAENRVSDAMNVLCGAVVTIEKLSMALARYIDADRTEGGRT